MKLNWREINQVLGTGQHVLLYGDPGFGKTHVASANTECYKVTMTEETAAAELRGHYIPRGNEFIWHNGPALLAWAEGRRLVVDEIDRSSGDALTFFYALLDDPAVAKLTLPSGETVRPAPGFQCIATTNALEPASVLPAALLSRFAIRIRVDELHPNALLSLSEDLRAAAMSAQGDELDRRVDFRQWKAFDNLRASLGAEVASRAIFGDRSVDVLNSLKLATRMVPDADPQIDATGAVIFRAHRV